MIEKLSGGVALQCGHRQVVSQHRLSSAHAGQEQFKVWCIECDDWSQLMPVQSDKTSQEED